MKRSLTSTAMVAAALTLLPAVASAQTPAPTTPTPMPSKKPAAKPKAKPKPAASGKATIAVRGGQATKKLRYIASGGAIRVKSTIKPYVAGQTALVQITRRGKLVKQKRVAVGRGGAVSARMTLKRGGLYAVRIAHLATPQLGAFVSRKVRVKAVSLSAGEGSKGTKVLLLQRGLASMGYAVPQTGFYDGGTSRAVLAYRKVNGMRRNGFADRAVYSRMLSGKGRFNLRFPKAGRHVEFDWSRQVLVLADKGRAQRIYHSSSGAPSTPTVFGTYRFYRREPGTNSHGMVETTYFIRGYAIHGYKSVPAGPASHGCLRVPIPNARQIYNAISLGEQIMVYR